MSAYATLYNSLQMLQDHSRIDVNGLARRAVEGCPEAEKELMEHLSVSFRAFAQHRLYNEHDAEEIVQEVLAVIWSKYREMVFEQSFQAWAYRILKNKLMDYGKQKRTRNRLLAETPLASPQPLETAEDAALRGRLLVCLRRIGSANSRYARILNLNYQGYSTEEICDRLSMTRGNCYTLLMRARQALLSCLEKQGGWK